VDTQRRNSKVITWKGEKSKEMLNEMQSTPATSHKDLEDYRMKKIRIKATGKVYELGNVKQAVHARCSSLEGYVALSYDWKSAKKVVEEYRQTGDKGLFDDWFFTLSFDEMVGDYEKNIQERYGDLKERALELINKYSGCTLMTGVDGCFYCTDTNELYRDTLDDEVLGDYAFEDDNLFYYIIPEAMVYLPEQVEIFDE